MICRDVLNDHRRYAWLIAMIYNHHRVLCTNRQDKRSFRKFFVSSYLTAEDKSEKKFCSVAIIEEKINKNYAQTKNKFLFLGKLLAIRINLIVFPRLLYIFPRYRHLILKFIWGKSSRHSASIKRFRFPVASLQKFVIRYVVKNLITSSNI